MLNTNIFPAEAPTDLPPILIVHGLYGSARNWGAIARGLAKTRTVLTVDQRNHGDSRRFSTQSYPDMAADLAEVIRAHGGKVDLLGHSMGGKASMQLALTEGALIRRLIVADIAPVAYAHDQSHHARAMQALDLDGITTRGEADRRLGETLDDAGLRAFFLQSLDIKAGRWKLNLDVLLAEMPKLVGWPETEGPGRSQCRTSPESRMARVRATRPASPRPRWQTAIAKAPACASLTAPEASPAANSASAPA